MNGSHLPLAQWYPATQCESALHDSRHALLEAQVRFPAQFRGAPETHDEAPSHEPAGVKLLPSQVAAPQAVPTAGTRH
ncbi:MAG: hypothetical protein M3020_15065 [Myxococcota bacterium]|nr:hypothetical protein [Myxococcota bacterium]